MSNGDDREYEPMLTWEEEPPQTLPQAAWSAVESFHRHAGWPCGDGAQGEEESGFGPLWGSQYQTDRRNRFSAAAADHTPYALGEARRLPVGLSRGVTPLDLVMGSFEEDNPSDEEEDRLRGAMSKLTTSARILPHQHQSGQAWAQTLFEGCLRGEIPHAPMEGYFEQGPPCRREDFQPPLEGGPPGVFLYLRPSEDACDRHAIVEGCITENELAKHPLWVVATGRRMRNAAHGWRAVVALWWSTTSQSYRGRVVEVEPPEGTRADTRETWALWGHHPAYARRQRGHQEGSEPMSLSLSWDGLQDMRLYPTFPDGSTRLVFVTIEVTAPYKGSAALSSLTPKEVDARKDQIHAAREAVEQADMHGQMRWSPEHAQDANPDTGKQWGSLDFNIDPNDDEGSDHQFYYPVNAASGITLTGLGAPVLESWPASADKPPPSDQEDQLELPLQPLLDACVVPMPDDLRRCLGDTWARTSRSAGLPRETEPSGKRWRPSEDGLAQKHSRVTGWWQARKGDAWVDCRDEEAAVNALFHLLWDVTAPRLSAEEFPSYMWPGGFGRAHPLWVLLDETPVSLPEGIQAEEDLPFLLMKWIEHFAEDPLFQVKMQHADAQQVFELLERLCRE